MTRMNLGLIAGIALLTCAFAGQAFADGPECTAKTVVIADDASVTNIVIDPIAAAPACSDSTGSNLQLTSVSAPAALTSDTPGLPPNTFTIPNDLAAGGSEVVNFTVTDENGAATSSSLTLVRQAPSN
ncbi:MAG: hypothetical protein WDN06_16205 [Asticcacaulis sp.]